MTSLTLANSEPLQGTLALGLSGIDRALGVRPVGDEDGSMLEDPDPGDETAAPTYGSWNQGSRQSVSISRSESTRLNSSHLRRSRMPSSA